MEDSPPVDPVISANSLDGGQAEPVSLERLVARVAALEGEVAALRASVRPATRAVPPVREAGMARAAFVMPVPEPSSHIAPPPVVPVPVAAPQKTLEDRLGSQVFNLVGIVALIFGTAWALKLAIEHGLLGPAERVVLGLVVGAGVILWSEIFRRKRMAAFSYTLKAVGSGVLYLSLWAAFQLYHLLPAAVALVAMILVTGWNAFMAFSQDAELLAGYALVGGLLTPVLLSTGGDHETFLFTYLGVIDLAVVWLQRSKAWPRLLPPTFLATVSYFIGYYAGFFHAGGRSAWDGQSSETASFALIFFGLFALVSTKAWTRDEPTEATKPGVLSSVLVPLCNAAFIGCALYSVFQDSGLHDALAWVMVGLAAMFLGLTRLQRDSMAAAVQLACAVVFVTIAIPLKASGQTLTVAWLVEGLVLYWASRRFDAGNNAGDQAPSRVLAVLSAGGYVLGLISVGWHWSWSYGVADQQPFFNANLGSALVAVAALGGAVWLSLPGAGETTERSGAVATMIASLSAIDVVALLLTLRDFTGSVQNVIVYRTPPTPFANANFATALVGLALLAATCWVSWRLAHLESEPAQRKLFRLVAAIDLVLFNLVAILIVEREIGALWTRAEADLQRSLAISGFLMVYAAALLAIGFWRRNAFVRWQALILILFTIAKVFLYDISGLSAGYRVASFLALGALLLTVSYAYQKDWLNLKDAPAAEGDTH